MGGRPAAPEWVGVLQDSCAAARYFRLAANQGLPNTQLNLGTLY